MSDFYRSSSFEAKAPLILTALFEPAAQARFEALRRAHYPPELNRVPAHLTLFHALPGAWQDDIEHHLAERCWQLDPLPAQLAGLHFTGHGVAIAIDCPRLMSLQAELAAAWRVALTPQDRQRFAPHVTLQNKVSPERARRSQAALATLIGKTAVSIEGLALWRYRGGPWEALGRFPFGAGPE
jgi:2'-5' RNA ligase